eukprot:TRINITY_DN4046_c0_g1_i2.p1 TRINITY_DN4046_c0_g1~~TRINITY_DN4046_c0_g1_i2.p1  ORF type:complete len:313 (-),score=52.52 TRINITY_DN4046_c0_g1_i2:643-1581(-)
MCIRDSINAEYMGNLKMNNDPIPIDPRMQEKYMQSDEFEKVRTELLKIEKNFRKGREEIYGFPRAVHPLAVSCKSLGQTFDLLYPSDSPFLEVGREFSDAFSGIVAAYNEMNRAGKDVTRTLDQWFVGTKSAIDTFAVRDKNKKAYEHYFQKLTKMKADRAAKFSRDIGYIEPPREVEWHIRNERKLEEAKNGYILTSQQSFNTATESLNLKYNYLNPILDTFAKNITRFFKTSSSSLIHLSTIEEKIQEGIINIKKREDEKKAEEVRKIHEMILKEKEEEEKKIKEQLSKEKELEEKNQKRNFGKRVKNAN